MSVQGQPDLAGIWNFEVAAIRAQETGGIAPGAIVNAPNTFNLITSITNEFFLSVVLHGATGTIAYHAERQEDNSVVNLPETPFTVPAATTFDVTSALFTTGPGADLDAGTYILTAIISMDTPFDSIVTAFFQTLLRVI